MEEGLSRKERHQKDRHRWWGMAALYLVAIVVVALLAAELNFTSWAAEKAGAGAPDAAAGEAQKDAPAEEKPPEEPTAYVLAKDDYSNLVGMTDPDKPVFDRYTNEDRLAQGLPTALPPGIAPYTQEPVAYLTFDDGPDDNNTIAILDILKAEGVHGTFYVTGQMSEAHPDVLRRIFDEGHAIGNHSYDHNYRDLYASKDNFLAQLRHTDAIIYSILGVRPLIVRAPGGTVGMFQDDFYTALDENGYVEHDWNVCTNDATGERPNAARQLYYVDSQTQGGMKDGAALVLMHCAGGKEETVKALPDIIHLLRDKGYRFGVVTPMTPQPW